MVKSEVEKERRGNNNFLWREQPLKSQEMFPQHSSIFMDKQMLKMKIRKQSHQGGRRGQG